MTGKNNNNAKKKKDSKQGGAAQPKRNTPRGQRKMVRFDESAQRLLAQVYLARGRPERYPDGADVATIPFRNYTRSTINTDANGNGVAVFLPGRLAAAVTNVGGFTVVGSNLTALSMTDVNDYANISANNTRYRVNAAYLRVGYVHNDLENQGRIAVKFFVSETGDLATLPADMPKAYGHTALEMSYGVLREGMTMTFPPVDERVRLFKPITSVVANDSYGHPACMIFIIGAKASTTVVEYELVQELELVPDSANYIARMAGEPPSDDPGLRQAIDREYHALRGSGMTIQPTDSYETFASRARSLISSLDPAALRRTIDVGRALYGTVRDFSAAGDYQMLGN